MEKEVTYCESCGAATTARSGVCADCRDADDEMSEQEIQSREEAGW